MDWKTPINELINRAMKMAVWILAVLVMGINFFLVIVFVVSYDLQTNHYVLV